jgi:hypothetical protein
LIQALLGPRQVGKTTAAIRLSKCDETVVFAADSPTPPPTEVIEQEWAKAVALPSENRTPILAEEEEPILAIEAKTNPDETVSYDRLLAKAGIHCPFLVVTPQNIQEFLTVRWIADLPLLAYA